MQAKAAVPKPAGDLKSKIKNTPSATVGLMTFELADLQGQNNQSDNYPSPGKGYQAGKPSETIGAIPDKVDSTCMILETSQMIHHAFSMHASTASSCCASVCCCIFLLAGQVRPICRGYRQQYPVAFARYHGTSALLLSSCQSSPLLLCISHAMLVCSAMNT